MSPQMHLRSNPMIDLSSDWSSSLDLAISALATSLHAAFNRVSRIECAVGRRARAGTAKEKKKASAAGIEGFVEARASRTSATAEATPESVLNSCENPARPTASRLTSAISAARTKVEAEETYEKWFILKSYQCMVSAGTRGETGWEHHCCTSIIA
jgi:hypothetical protein